jgi:molybdopterin-containing oxidoreductase family membrane subunit
MVSIVINIGMWLERYVIVVTSLERDFVPAHWANYYPTRWDWATYIGTLGFFLFMMFLFIRALPMISIAEMRGMVPPREAVKGAHAETGVHA